MNPRLPSFQITAGLSVLLFLTIGCTAVSQRDELPTTVLLIGQFYDPDRFADYECLQVTPATSPLTNVADAAREEFLNKGPAAYEVVNCPQTESTDSDFVCDDWVQAQGCELRKLFSTSYRGEKIRWYQCGFG